MASLGIEVVWSELIQISSWLIIKLQPRRIIRSLILRAEMFSADFAAFASFKLLFCHDSLENIADIMLLRSIVPLSAAKQRIHNYNIQNLPILRVAS